MKGSLSLLGFALSLGMLIPAFQPDDATPHYKVLAPTSQGNLRICLEITFPYSNVLAYTAPRWWTRPQSPHALRH